MKTEQIIEEREDSVKMKMRFKRFLSGFMAVATLASVIIQPVAVSASELEPEEIPFEQQYTVSGATCSSKAIKDACQKAFDAAKK